VPDAAVPDAGSRAPEELLVGFAAALRRAGMAVTPDRTSGFLQAVSLVGLDDRTATYWAGRATLCCSPDDNELYDRAFAAWFSELPGDVRPAQPASAAARPRTAGGLVMSPGTESADALLARASDAEQLRHRDVAELTEPERVWLAQLFETLVVVPPVRRSMRRRPYRRGAIDLRRTLRAQLRAAGEPARLRYRRPARRPRRIVLLVDVSGSMEPYADALLRLAHRIVRALPGQAEVFTIGTRLTRVTTALSLRQPDDALVAAGRLVPDWSGGTRLGEVIGAFADRWGRRGMARNAVVVIASDGWERGDPELLGEQMRRLRLLAHAVIWMNPHRGKPGYAPIQAGIRACLPHLDALVAGHSLAAFAELLGVLADA
jgi:uncharacterized protein with von Willebrand factor type A (vWA) domain